VTTSKMHYISARVTGSGPFPLDMLRYDSCWPARPEDVIALLSKEQRTVLIARWSCSKTGGWKPARWQSFGWTLEEVTS